MGDKPREKQRLPAISSAYVLGPRLHTSLCLHVSSLVKEYLKGDHQVRWWLFQGGGILGDFTFFLIFYILF